MNLNIKDIKLNLFDAADGELLEEAESEFSVIDLNCPRVRSLPKNLLNYFRKSTKYSNSIYLASYCYYFFC